MKDELWSVTGAHGTEQAVHSRLHGEAMVEALASMGIRVELTEWSGTAAEHASCMAESAKWAEAIQ